MQPFKQVFQDATSGDERAIEKIIEKYSTVVEKECARYGLWQLPDWSHSDLFQEVIFRVLTKLHQFNGIDTDDPEVVFENWLRTTTNNLLKNVIRDHTTKSRVPENSFEDFSEVTKTFYRNRNRERTVSSIFMRDEEYEQLLEAIDECLDENGQKILMLRVVEGLSIRQISEQLRLTYDQVRYKFDASVAKLKKKLGPQF